MADRARGRTLERGSIVVLMPATVLVVVLLGAMALDRAQLVMAQRDDVDTAQEAATEAAAAGVSLDHLRRTGEIRYDPRLIERAVAHATSDSPEDVVRWWVDGPVVWVRIERTVDVIVGSPVTGRDRRTSVHATASAELQTS